MHDSGRILRGSAGIIEAVISRKAVLDEEMENVDPRYRRSIGHLVLTFFRRRKAIDALLAERIEKAPRPAVLALLQAVLTQIFFQRAIAAESAVNIAVSEAKKFKADKFVNAVLRRILAVPNNFEESPEKVLPAPILKRWAQQKNEEQLPLFSKGRILRSVWKKNGSLKSFRQSLWQVRRSVFSRGPVQKF